MAPSTGSPLLLFAPPWPPDPCLISRDLSGELAEESTSRLLHPEVSPPPSSDLPSLPPSSIVPSTTVNPISSSPSPASWVSKLQSSAHNLTKMASPTFTDDGTPVVKAPESVILKSSAIWKGHLVAQFHGTAPSPSKIFADLNPIWGKQGRIRVRYHSKNVCLIFIPCELARRWVLDVGLWHSGKCAFSVFEWSPNISLTPMKLEYAPVWILFRGIPQELWTLQGFSTIATGVGFPIQSEFPKITPYSNGAVKLRVTIKLDGKRAHSVKVVDKLGNSVLVSAEYLKLPHKCEICSEYGHSELRCPDRQPLTRQTLADRNAPPAVPPVLPDKSAASSDSVPAGSPNSKRLVRASNAARSSNGSSLQTAKPQIRRTRSLPNTRNGSLSPHLAGGSREWIPVGHRPPSPRAKSPPPQITPRAKTPPDRVLTPGPSAARGSPPVCANSQYDSEEELIRIAQSILRKRIAAAEAELPPFSSEKDKRKIRRQQRQAMVKLCNNLDDSSSHSVLQQQSDIPIVVTREPSPNGKSPLFIEA
ncbi:hypothetical protein Rs2_50726 [Raphanus sativus]|nr:hypothetical protein Rs2_50726 [Raphanus sativus]